MKLTAIAYHEAGHAVAGQYHRIALRSATIVPSADASGKVEHRQLFRRDFYFDNSNRARLRAEGKSCPGSLQKDRTCTMLINRPSPRSSRM